MRREITTTYEGIDRESGEERTVIIVHDREYVFTYSKTGDGMWYQRISDPSSLRWQMKRLREQGLVRTHTRSRMR